MPDLMTIDFAAGTVTDGTATHSLATAEGFAAVSRAWLRAGWDAKYVYSFSWLGRPIIQLPEDMVRLQEVIFHLKPDVILETGVAHGGSLVFSASLCKLMGKGRVIGVDIEIRPHNRSAIEAHFLANLITLVEGGSTDSTTVSRVKELIAPGETVLVLLDSNHTKAHVLAELDAYSDLVTPGSYIVAMDGVLELIPGAPRTTPESAWNNPATAAREFAARRPEFEIAEPDFAFNEGAVRGWVTYWPSAFLRRKLNSGSPSV
jgi:cephalosporin hydroxylase